MLFSLEKFQKLQPKLHKHDNFNGKRETSYATEDCLDCHGQHCGKCIRIRSYSGPYFSAFGLIRTLFNQCNVFGSNQILSTKQHYHRQKNQELLEIKKAKLKKNNSLKS